MKYPKTLYVQIEKDISNSNMILADENIEGRDNGKVAIYELKKIVNKKTKVIIED